MLPDLQVESYCDLPLAGDMLPDPAGHGAESAELEVAQHEGGLYCGVACAGHASREDPDAADEKIRDVFVSGAAQRCGTGAGVDADAAGRCEAAFVISSASAEE